MAMKNKFIFKIFLIVLAVVFIFLLIIPKESYLEDYFSAQLVKRNIPLKNLSISRFNTSGITFKKVELEERLLNIENLEVNYSFKSLVKQEIESLSFNLFSIDKEKLMERLIKKTNDGEKLGLKEMVESIPVRDLNVRLENIEGLLPGLQSSHFPTHLIFNKESGKGSIEIKSGLIESIDQIRDLRIDTKINFHISGETIQVSVNSCKLTIGKLNLKENVLNNMIISIAENSKIALEYHKKNSNLSVKLIDLVLQQSEFSFPKFGLQFSNIKLLGKGSLNDLKSSVSFTLTDISEHIRVLFSFNKLHSE